MRISYALFSLLLLLVSAEFSHARAIHGANAARMPEHTCHKLLSMNRSTSNVMHSHTAVSQCRSLYSGTVLHKATIIGSEDSLQNDLG
ncbi:hypothetical protein Peur_045623 [Populus x canadensis]